MLRFRAHHFLCTLCFKGKGYSPDFIKNYENIFQKLNSKDGDVVPIKVTSHTDSICQPCPHRKGKKCQTETRVQTLDKAHAAALGIKEGDVVTWGEAKKRIAQKINLDTFDKICAPCSWKKFGICEGVIKGLNIK